MKLQSRLTLALVLVVLVATGTSTAIIYRSLERQFERDFQQNVDAAKESVARRLYHDGAALRVRVQALSHDPRIQTLLLDLEHGRYDADSQVQKQVRRDLEALRRSADLDVLWLFDGGRVLAAAHRIADAGVPPALARWLQGRMRDHVVIKERVERAGRPALVSVLEVGVERGRLVIVGGRVLGDRVAEGLRVGGSPGAEVTLLDRDGVIIASTLASPSINPVGFSTARVAHHNDGEESAALSVAVHVGRERLHHQRESLFRAAAIATGAAMLLAIVIGWLIARRVAFPVMTLVAATREIAEGGRDVALPRGGGDEVGELIHAFQDMIQELTESEQALRRAERVAAWQDIARELAHEIKNPLTPIRMAIETVRRTWQRKHPRFEEVFDESTATILEEVERLKTIVSEFSQFARMPSPNPRPCDLNGVVHQAVVLYGQAPGVRIEETLDDALGLVNLDPERMAQVIQNLIKNAIQASEGVEGGGVVQVGTRALPKGAVELYVADNGLGIAADDLPRVFTPYFTGKVGGTGLGLAVVHRIVSGHNGRVGVSSEPGKGTRFVVRLPARQLLADLEET